MNGQCANNIIEQFLAIIPIEQESSISSCNQVNSLAGISASQKTIFLNI